MTSIYWIFTSYSTAHPNAISHLINSCQCRSVHARRYPLISLSLRARRWLRIDDNDGITDVLFHRRSYLCWTNRVYYSDMSLTLLASFSCLFLNVCHIILFSLLVFIKYHLFSIHLRNASELIRPPLTVVREDL